MKDQQKLGVTKVQHNRTISTGRGIIDQTKSKEPRAEVYGFVIWVSSFIIYFMYLGWAFIPEPILTSFQITYYPDKYWSIAFPCYILVLYLTFFFASIFYHHFKTKPLDSLYTIKDEYTLFDDKIYEADQVPPFSDMTIDQWNDLLLRNAK